MKTERQKTIKRLDAPTRLQQVRFALSMMGFGALAMLFILANANTRAEFRDMIAGVFREIT